MQSKSILLMAYQISPSKGSEYSVGWNVALELAKTHSVYVLCGVSGEHMGDTEEVENYFKIYPHPNVHLLPVKPPKLALFINWFNKIGFGPVFYLAFRIWHRKAYQIAKELVSSRAIDVVHQLGPIGFREPGYLWNLDRPFVWGPIGGALAVNPALLEHASIKSRLFYKIKNRITFLQLAHSERVRAAANKASELIFSSVENRVNFERFCGKSGLVISEQGTFSRLETGHNSIERSKVGRCLLNLIWAGRVAPEKNLDFLFRALGLVGNKEKWRLNIVGGGTETPNLKKLALELGIAENIIWHGRRSRGETMEIMRVADLNVLTSLYEGNPAVLFEAISLGVPTISLDSGGMHSVLADGNGILVPITTYEETLRSYAQKLAEILADIGIVAQLRERTKAMFDEHLWANKIKKFDALYDHAIANFDGIRRSFHS